MISTLKKNQDIARTAHYYQVHKKYFEKKTLEIIFKISICLGFATRFLENYLLDFKISLRIWTTKNHASLKVF